MVNYDRSLDKSYLQHPYFTFDAPEMELDANLLADFVAPYNQLVHLSRQLSRSQLQQVERQAATALAAIFSRLQGQALDIHERQFLQELEVQCLRLLSEQADFAGEQKLIRMSSRSDGRALAYAGELSSQRFFFGALPAAVIAEVQDVAAESVRGLRQSAAQGKLKREDLTVSSGPAVRHIVKILNRAFREAGILAAVSSYSGVTMEVSGLALELSVPQSGWWASSFPQLARAPRTLYAHLDESIQNPKSIVYLTDVAANNGATSCYPGTYEALGLNPLQDMVGRVVGVVGTDAQSPLHDLYKKQYHQSMTSEAFRRHYMHLPVAMRFNSHFGWDVLPDSALESSMVEVERVMTGPAGTFMVFDGARLVHRGGLIQSGERVVLQVIFSAGGMRRRVIRKIRSIFA